MKTGMKFGFGVVNAGQRNVVVEPQVIATATEGSFRITAPVSRALGVAHGDYIMFINNLNEVDDAIRSNHPDVVAFCEAQGLELGSVEAAIAIHKEFDIWGIAKGIIEYDPKGNQNTITERLTKKDKVRFVSQNFDDMLSQAMESGDDELKEALTHDGVTKEEQIDVLSKFVVPRELPKYKGSKAANPAKQSGVGVSLLFTDSNVWNQLRVDLSDNERLNRVFDVDVENMQKVNVNNGYKDITVDAIILDKYTDKEPSRFGEDEE